MEAAEVGAHALWVQQVRDILREADPSAWRAERADELRRRVKEIVAAAQRRSSEGAPARFRERVRTLVAAMERSLPVESTRSRWAAFVSEVHPEYEALLASMPADGLRAQPNHRPTNYARSLLHFASAGVGFASVALFPSRRTQLVISISFAVYAWSMEIVRRVSPGFNKRLMRFYGPVAHPHEHFRVNSATWFATALVLLATFSARPGMIAGLAVLGVADPLAALVGRRWGKHQLRAGRSLEGTLAFFLSGIVAAAAGLALVGIAPAGRTLGFAVAASIAGAMAELWTMKLDDNLTIPLVVGAVVTAGLMAGF